MSWQPPAGENPVSTQFPSHGSPVSGAVAPPGRSAEGPVYVLSGWWRRAGAYLIDGLVVAFVPMLLSVAADVFFDANLVIVEPGDKIKLGWQVGAIAANIVSFLLLVALVMQRTNGRTFGKMATGIRVVREDGQPISFGFAVRRDFVIKQIWFGLLGFITLGVALLLNYLWPLRDPQNRALHDRMVKTRVVRVDPTGSEQAVNWSLAERQAASPQIQETAAPPSWGDSVAGPPGAPPFPHAPGPLSRDRPSSDRPDDRPSD